MTTESLTSTAPITTLNRESAYYLTDTPLPDELRSIAVLLDAYRSNGFSKRYQVHVKVHVVGGYTCEINLMEVHPQDDGTVKFVGTVLELGVTIDVHGLFMYDGTGSLTSM